MSYQSLVVVRNLNFEYSVVGEFLLLKVCSFIRLAKRTVFSTAVGIRLEFDGPQFVIEYNIGKLWSRRVVGEVQNIRTVDIMVDEVQVLLRPSILFCWYQEIDLRLALEISHGLELYLLQIVSQDPDQGYTKRSAKSAYLKEGSKEHVFGSALQPEELQWLVAEIKSHLQLPS